MILSRKIKKLTDQEVHVELKNYSLFNIKYAEYFWSGAILFLLLFAIFTGLLINKYYEKKSLLNPDLVMMKNVEAQKKRDYDSQKQKSDHDNFAKDKEQYINGCKSSGKYPSYMGDDKSLWECK